MPDPSELDKLRADMRKRAGLPPLDVETLPLPTPGTDEGPDFSSMTADEIGSFFTTKTDELSVARPERTPVGGRAQKALDAVDFAVSGKTFLKKITGGRIDIENLDTPLPDFLDRILEETIDLTVNPLTAATVIAAPIAVPARLAASPLGRLVFRISAETAAGALGNFAAGKVAENIPEESSMAVKLGAPLLAALAVGGGTAFGANRAIRNSNDAILTNLAAQETRNSARSIGNRFLGTLNEQDDIVAAFPKGSKALGQFEARMGIDPVRGETTDAGLAYHAYGRQRAVARSAAATGLMAAFPEGLSAFRFADGAIDNANAVARQIQWNDAFAFKDADIRFKFNVEQTAQWKTYNTVVDDTKRLLEFHGINRPVLDTGGKLYVPRQVRNAPVGEFQRPSDAALMRVHESATEGAQLGANYLDPQTTLQLHVETAYKEIADLQFDQAITKLTVGTEDAFKASTRGHAIIQQHKAAQSALTKAKQNQRILQTSIDKTRARISEARRSGTKARIERLDAELDAKLIEMDKSVAPATKAANRAERDVAQQLTAARKSFKSTTALPGHMFGRTDETISVGRWKESFIPKEDFDKLTKYFDTTRGSPLPPTTGPIVRNVGDVGDALRTASATADFAMPFIQGLPLMATDPAAWARMAGNHYLAFFRPGTQGRYIQRNLDAIQDMVVNGRVPLGDVEVFTAVRQGGAFPRLAKFIEQAPGGKAVTGATRQTLGRGLKRFEGSYNTGLMVARAEMWKALRKTWGGTSEELGSYIRNMTGGMDTAAHGVGNGQRAVESLLMFSPKLMRSTMALVAKAARPWTAEGAEAAHALFRITAATGGIMALAQIAAGTAAGETDAEIENRVRDGLKPWEGKKFLSVEYEGEWYGVGGQVRAITQFLANSVVGLTNEFGFTDEKGRTTNVRSISENPLTGFLMSRTSPAARDAAAAAELLTGEKLNLLPFETVDSVPKLAEVIGTSGLPFVLQGILEEARDPVNDVSPTLALADFLGARASALSPFERRDDIAIEEHNYRYNDLTNQQKQAIDDAHPELVAATKEYGDLAERDERQQLELIDQTAFGTLIRLEQRRVDGKVASRMAFREQVEDTLTARAISARTARAPFGDDFEPTSLPGLLLNRYYETFNLARLDHKNDNSPLDFDLLDQLQGELDADIKAGAFGDPAAAQKIIDERQRFSVPPELQWYMDNKDVISEAGYWDTKDTVFQSYVDQIHSFRDFRDVESAGGLQARILLLSETGNTVAARQGQNYLRLIEKVSGQLHERMRRADSRLDRALVENGYTTTRLTFD